MKRILTYFLTVVMLLIQLGSYAQSTSCTFTIAGQIIDEHDQLPLEYASIFIKELKRGTSADSKGYYAIKDICPGTYTIEISHVGCDPKNEKVDINGNVKRQFYLEHHLEELNEVMVIGKGEKENSLVSSEKLTDVELAQSRGKSLGESLRLLNGVNTLQTGPTISKPVIHGLHSNRVLIMNNNVRQEGQQWGQEHAPEIDPFSGADFSVIKGASSIKYGADAIGGIVLVQPKPLARSKSFSGDVSTVLNSNNRQFVVAGKVAGGTEKGIGWRLQGSAKKGGDAKSADYSLSNTGVREKNFSAAIGLNKSNHGMEVYFSHFESDIAILRSAHIGNVTDLINAINSDRPIFIEEFTYQLDNPRQEVKHDLLKLTGRWKLADKGEIKFQYAFQANSRKEYDRRRGNNFNIPSISLNLFTHTLDFLFEQRPKAGFKGEFGVNSILQRNKNNEGTNASFLIPDYKNFGIGIYGIEKLAGENWELEAGIRYDYKRRNPLIFNDANELLRPKYAFNNLSTSVGGLYQINDYFGIHANVSTAWRPPNISELFSNGLHHGAAAIEQGLVYPGGALSANLFDLDIQTEQAINSNLGLEYVHKNLSIEGSFYLNTINNFIYIRPNGIRLSIRGAFPVFQYTSTNARFVGFDGTLKYNLSEQWSFQNKTALIRAKNTSEGGELINIPANSFRNGLTYSASGDDNKIGYYFTFEAQTVSRQTNAPDVFLDFENAEPPTGIYDLKEAPKGYTLLNFHSGVELDKMKLGFSIENLLNESYRDYMNRFRYFADDLGINYSIRLIYNF
ncbi:MAG: iron complex outermembrane receptor protein [Cyclobacteriaceae bacterium]|jgi:iron complex outermembrane receptor protein